MKTNYIFLFIIPVAFITLLSFKPGETNEEKKISTPDEVQKIIENSCYGCHNLGSRNEKARNKMSFDALDTLSLISTIGILGEIAEEVESDKMPPARFLEHKPEAKLSKQQKEDLIKWAEEQAALLME